MDLLFGWDSMVTPSRLAPATCMQPALAQPQVLPLVADFDISDPNHVDDEEVGKAGCYTVWSGGWTSVLNSFFSMSAVFRRSSPGWCIQLDAQQVKLLEAVCTRVNDAAQRIMTTDGSRSHSMFRFCNAFLGCT